ncbi:MAG: RNA polymerase sigma factor [Clostridium chrysemydis]|uniref:RNA polymerase sigma factor n=1 Tax=Clostridium chrysemydis TaxID=2665504 RepID=UPI003F2E225E
MKKQEKAKNYIYDLNEFVGDNGEKNEETLFMFIKTSIEKNFILRSTISSIKTLDNSLDENDICTECYFLATKHFNKTGNYNIYDLNNDIKDLLKYLLASKRKHEKAEFEENVFDKPKETRIDDSIFLKNLLESLSEEDRKIIYLYYFEGYTYEQITEFSKIKTKRGIKKKIDTILENIRATIM